MTQHLKGTGTALITPFLDNGSVDFDGLESTTDEMLETLRTLRIEADLLKEVTDYLYRCDLIKFAKVFPDRDEVDLVLLRAEQMVQQTIPLKPAVETTEPIQDRQGELSA